RNDADGHGDDRPVCRPSEESAAAESRRARFRAAVERVDDRSGYGPAEHAEDERLQRAHDQWQSVSFHGAARLQNRRSSAHSTGQSRRHGSSPDAHPRLSLPGERHRRRRYPACGAVAGIDGRSRRRPDARPRVYCRRAGRLGISLPHDASRDESDGASVSQHARRQAGRSRRKNTIAMKGLTGPFRDYISMGGMMTILKVRDRLKSYDEDPGWYEHPAGTVAMQASESELARDGITLAADGGAAKDRR